MAKRKLPNTNSHPAKQGCFCSSLQSNEEEDPLRGHDVGGGSATAHTQSPAKQGASLSRIQRVGDHVVCPDLSGNKQRGVEGGGGGSAATTKMQKRRDPGQNTGRRSSWPQIKSRLAEIENLIGEKFVLVRDVPPKHLGISYQTFLVLRGKHPELEDAVQRGKEHRNELVLKGMYDLATGRAVRVEDEKSPDGKGKLRLTKRRIVRFEPQADIGTMLMKQYAGWRDNPKTDDAIAKALSGEDWTAKISLIPGFSDLRPKSSEADNFKAPPKDLGNRADEGAPAEQSEKIEKEGDDDGLE